MIFRDQLGREIELAEIPKRIVSLVPSQTELLYDLGAGDRVVGITKFCIHPVSWFESKTRVGGTKNIHLDKVKDLQPDLIIANKEENTFEDVLKLQEIAPVWISDVNTFTDASEMILSLGRIINAESSANVLLLEIEQAFLSIQKRGGTALYFIWKDPYLVVGKNTFIDSMLTEAGFENFCRSERYPEIQPEKTGSPDFIFLSTEPYPFNDEHVRQFEKWFPNSQVCLVDGEMFSWYGSRLKMAPGYFNELIEKLA
jgi:ABC-type Fe3+-hydroxamate transport system substrate-binding protein